MTLRVPTTKAKACGMRALASPESVDEGAEDAARAAPASSAPCGAAAPRNTKPRSIRATWSRSPRWCATCTAPSDQPEQSYSERQLYESALDRMARELAAVEHITETEAAKQIETNLLKGPRRTPKGADDEAREEAA